MIDLVNDYEAGKLELFAPPKKPGPPPGTAPAKDRVRARVIELRRQGLSTYEISARLAAEGTPLNRTVGRRDPHRGRVRPAGAPPRAGGERQPGHLRARHPAAAREGARLRRPGRRGWTRPRAGLLLALPDLVAPRPASPGPSGRLPRHPRSSPPCQRLLSLLALKLTRTRRVSHVDDLLRRPGRGPVRRAGRPCRRSPRWPPTPTSSPTTTSSASSPPWTTR